MVYIFILGGLLALKIVDANGKLVNDENVSGDAGNTSFRDTQQHFCLDLQDSSNGTNSSSSDKQLLLSIVNGTIPILRYTMQEYRKDVS